MNKLDVFISTYGIKIIIIGLTIGTLIATYLSINEVLPHGYLGIVVVITAISLLVCAYCLKKPIKNPCVESCSKKLSSYTYVPKILQILFFLTYTYCLLSIHFAGQRGYLYFFILTIGVITLVSCIIYSKKSGCNVLTLICILAFGLLFTVSNFQINYWNGIDTWTHAFRNELVSTLGYIDVGFIGKEAIYPLQHISVALTSILASIEIRSSTIMVTLIPSIILSLVIFSITRKQLGNIAGLLATLMYNTATYTLIWRMLGQTTSYAANLYLILLLIFSLVALGSRRKTNYILFIIVSISIIFTHQFSSYVILIVLIGFYLSSILHKKHIITESGKLLAIYLILQLLYSISTSAWGLKFIVQTVLQGLTGSNNILNYVGAKSPASDTSTVTNIVDVLNDTLSLIPVTIFMVALPLILLIIQTIYLYKHKERFEGGYVLQYIVIPYLILLMSYIATGMLYTTMSNRFAIYLLPFASLAGSFVMVKFMESETKITKTLVIVILSLLIILSVGQPVINEDNYLFGSINEKSSVNKNTYIQLTSITDYLSPDKTVTSDKITLEVIKYIDPELVVNSITNYQDNHNLQQAQSIISDITLFNIKGRNIYESFSNYTYGQNLCYDGEYVHMYC